MASYGYTFNSGDSVTPTRLNAARTVSDIVNADIKSDAAIAHSKLANIPSGQLLLGNGSNVPTATAVTGDVTISNTGVTAIAAGSIVTADLADGAVTSSKIADGTIVNADINASAAIAGTKIAPDFGSQNIATTGTLTAGATTAATLSLTTGSNPLYVATASEPYIEIRDTTATTRSYLQASNGLGAVGTISNHPFRIIVNSIERARIDTNGRVGIAKTNPATALDVNGTVTATDFAGNLTGTASAIADGSVSSSAKIANSVVTAEKLSGAQTGSAPIYGCRAWVNFDGTKDTTGAASTANTNRSLRGSGNVSSVLRNGTGDYTINFTTAMPNANYSALITSEMGSGNGGFNGITGTPATSSVRIVCYSQSGAARDIAIGCVSVFA